MSLQLLGKQICRFPQCAFGLDWSHLNLELELRAKQSSTTYIGNRRYFSHMGPPVAQFAEFSNARLGHTYQLMMPYCSCSLSQMVVFSQYYHLSVEFDSAAVALRIFHTKVLKRKLLVIPVQREQPPFPWIVPPPASRHARIR